MPSWEEKRNESVRYVNGDEVTCYMDRSFSVDKYDAFDAEEYKKDKESDCFKKTYVINCGSTDGEYIDLFQLQEWFDKNRDWVNELKKECNN